jgi:hypothetical protein
VLAGDSIFDNGAYTSGELDVIAHLGAILPPDWRATLCAVDGATSSSVVRQFARVPRDATHLVVAVGGNDAIGSMDLLSTPVRSTADALRLFGQRVAVFETSYATAVAAAAALSLPLTLCTIYNGQLDETRAPLARVALMMFNDVIVRVAFARRAGIVDLRSVCADAADYANPIEPSGRGGRKIAAAIARCVGAIGSDAAAIRLATF